MGGQGVSSDMQRGSESCAANLQRSPPPSAPRPLFRLLSLTGSREVGGDRRRRSHGVSAVCCMYRDERVIFVVNAECSRVLLCFGFVFFSHPLPLLCTDMRCVWDLCTCWGCVSLCAWKNWTPGPPRDAATGEQAKWMFKTKTRGGRREGGNEMGKWGEGIHALWRTDRAGGETPCSTPLGLCKCIVSKLCSMFDSLVPSTALLFVPCRLTLFFPLCSSALVLSYYLFLSLLIGLWILL